MTTQSNTIMMDNHLDNRMKLIEKIDNNKNYEPAEEELELAYGYLDTCLSCGKRLRFVEPFNHGFEGNVHKFGCSVSARGLGYLYFVLKIITIPIWVSLFFLIFFIQWIVGKFK